MKTRYYADADIREWHEHALRLLKTLHDEHGITVEIDRIDEQHGPITDFPGEVRYPSPEEVYERDLKRNRKLNQTIDPTPSEAFKRYEKIDIAGNIAVIDDEGTVQWASTLPGYADDYGLGAESQTAMDFLEDIVTTPSNRICVECLHLLDGARRSVRTVVTNYHNLVLQVHSSLPAPRLFGCPQHPLFLMFPLVGLRYLPATSQSELKQSTFFPVWAEGAPFAPPAHSITYCQ